MRSDSASSREGVVLSRPAPRAKRDKAEVGGGVDGDLDGDLDGELEGNGAPVLEGWRPAVEVLRMSRTSSVGGVRFMSVCVCVEWRDCRLTLLLRG
jgi:hypothetical protein